MPFLEELSKNIINLPRFAKRIIAIIIDKTIDNIINTPPTGAFNLYLSLLGS